MCPECLMQNAAEWRGDVTARYSFVADRLVYNDAPLTGYLRCRHCSCAFVFQCRCVGQDRAWEWLLVPVTGVNAINEDALLVLDLATFARQNGCPLIKLTESAADSVRSFHGRHVPVSR